MSNSKPSATWHPGTGPTDAHTPPGDANTPNRAQDHTRVIPSPQKPAHEPETAEDHLHDHTTRTVVRLTAVVVVGLAGYVGLLVGIVRGLG